MGKFIVIEGTDGAGKSTQTKRLAEYLKKKGLRVKTFHFPSGKGFYGEIVNAFLRGDYGKVEEVDPYFVAFAFAGDRKETAEEVRRWLQEYDVVLMDRYTFSNIAYQCAKLEEEQEQKKLMDWIFRLEFEVFRIPKPDLSVFLNVPESFTRRQLDRERTGAEREYLRGKSDVHEDSLELQRRVRKQYTVMCREYAEIVLLDCTNENGAMLHGDKIQKRIIRLLREAGIID